MSETLLIHYHYASAEQASWSLCNELGELTTKISTGPLSEIASIAGTHHSIVLLDSTCLHIDSVQLPTQNTQKMLRAIPYALEDFIADDVDDFHFVFTHDKQQNKTAVVGIKKTTLQSIIDNFDAAGIVIDTLVPDALCLAADNRQWVILNQADTCYFQSSTYYGGIFTINLLPYILQKSLTQDDIELPEKLLVFTANEDPDENQHTAELTQNINQVVNKITSDTDNPHNIEIMPIRYNTHPLVVFCGSYKQALPLNLLHGSFKTRRKSSGNLQYWRLTASLAVIWLALHLGLTGFQYTQLKQNNIETRALIRQIYKKTFPESKRIVNARMQMEQKLNTLKKGGNADNGLLFLLSESFGTLKQDKNRVTLQSLNYRNNRMDIGLDSTNLQAIENLNKQLNKNPAIKAEITSSSAEKNRVKGNLRIEAGS